MLTRAHNRVTCAAKRSRRALRRHDETGIRWVKVVITTRFCAISLRLQLVHCGLTAGSRYAEETGPRDLGLEGSG